MAYNQLPMLVKQGGTGIASATAYAPIVGGTTTTGAFQSASTGFSTAGYVLTSTGSSSLPTFQSSGGWNYLVTETASSSASLAFTSVVTSTYINYVLLFSNVLPATAGDTLNLTVSNDNGSTYVVTNYQSGITSFPYNSTTASNVNTTSTCYLSAALATTVGACGAVYMTVQSGAVFVATGDVTYFANSTNLISTSNINSYNTSTTMNAFKITMSTGNISTGTFTLFGISK